MSANTVRTHKAARFAYGAAAASVGVALLAACGSSGTASSNGHTAATAGPGGNASSGPSAQRTQSTSIGTVAADPSGRTLYELVGNPATDSKCTGSCLSIWPAAKSGGTQVILHGHPAHTFVKDTAPGQISGQGVTDQWGTWYALDGQGTPITKKAPPGSSSSSSQSGGYGY